MFIPRNGYFKKAKNKSIATEEKYKISTGDTGRKKKITNRPQKHLSRSIITIQERES